MKDIVEQLAGGLRQGPSLGAPAVYIQEHEPKSVGSIVLQTADFWIKPSGPHLYYWTGSEWKKVVS